MTHAPLLFVASVIVLLVAHGSRALRQSYLFSPRELSGRFDLLLGLAIGYVINAIVPFRLGELFRAGFVAKRERLRFAYVLASVAAERLSDLVDVGVFDAAAFRFHLWHQLAKCGQKLLALAACGTNRSNYVDHRFSPSPFGRGPG